MTYKDGSEEGQERGKLSVCGTGLQDIDINFFGVQQKCIVVTKWLWSKSEETIYEEEYNIENAKYISKNKHAVP